MSENSPSSELQKLNQSIDKLHTTRFITMHNSIWQLLWINFLKGVALGFGTIVGATVVLWIVVSILSQMDFIPIIGEWATRLIEILEQG